MSSAQPQITAQRVDYRGDACVRLANDTVEVLLATGFGPRVLRYAFTGGENLFGEVKDSFIDTALGRWTPRGGHRLWAAPEHMPLSYAPDNDPVTVAVTAGSVTLRQPADAAGGLQKELTLTLAESGTQVTVAHRLLNRQSHHVEVAPWALTIMNAGGTVILPQEPFAPHPDVLLPVRAMALWAFTDLSDPRWSFGPRFIRLRTDAGRASAQKVGIANHQGWAAYHREGLLFVKRYGWDDTLRYPDMGVNTETFTAGAFIELETLGGLASLAPGAAAEHEERWFLFHDVDQPADDGALAAVLGPHLQTTR